MKLYLPYHRRKAIEYAHRWAYGRNPAFYDYEEIGGDCTNFASQCLYAGTGIMNYQPDYGWYYIGPNQKSPAWTGVPYFYQFLMRDEPGNGPFAVEISLEEIQPGDFVQLKFRQQTEFGHTPIVVETGATPTPENTLLAAHSQDADWRPLSTYSYETYRCLHILGAYLF